MYLDISQLGLGGAAFFHDDVFPDGALQHSNGSEIMMNIAID
jgi:hypothetical protein